MRVPFLDLKHFWRKHERELEQVFARVGSSGIYLNGPETRAFEDEFAKFCDSEFCVSVHSGLDALKILLMSVGIGPGDTVLVSSNTFIATWLAIDAVGANIKPIETCESTLNLKLDDIRNALDENVKAVITVNMYGNPIDLRDLYKSLRERGIWLFQDQAQSHGAKIENVNVCQFSDASAFSFYPGKNLGAFGDGGAIVTNDTRIASKSRQIANYGQKEKYNHTQIGVNSRLGELQAGILSLKLKQLAEVIEIRQLQAKRYFDALSNDYVAIPEFRYFENSVFHLFPIFVRNGHRDLFRDFLIQMGVETLIHYPIPPHKQAIFEKFQMLYPNTEKICDCIVSLPIGPHLNEQDIDYVVTMVNDFKM